MERLPSEEAVRLAPLVLEHFGHWGQQAEKYLHQLLSCLLTSVETATAHSLRRTGENVYLINYRDGNRK